MKSLIEHNPEVMIYVFAEDDELPFKIPCRHRIINISQQTYFPKDGPNMHNWFTYCAMMRACAADLIPEDRVISLDVDTIICDSLQPIWEMDLTDKWLGWCPEYKGWHKPFGKTYYNFGVSVLNLAQMRKDGVVAKAVEILNTEECTYLEQDVFNRIAVPDKCADIPVRFNESFCCGETDDPAIVHYAGYADWFVNMRRMPRRDYLLKYMT